MPSFIPAPPRIGPVIFHVDVGVLESLPESIERNAYFVIEKYGFEIKKLAQYYVPVDQGAAKASIYLRTKKINEQAKAYAEARIKALTEESRWNNKGRNLRFAQDDVDELNPKELQALICVGVIYGYDLEYQSPNVAATNPGAQRPYLTPAFAHFERQFLDAMTKIFEGL